MLSLADVLPAACRCCPADRAAQAFLASIAQAVQGFLDAHAAAFAGQLWSFLESGLSISAHDALLFGAEGAAAASSDDEQAQGPEAEVAAVEAGT
jgi:hypothetical protein